MRPIRLRLVSAFLVLCAVPFISAMAQEVVEEIIVTAQRRAENIQDVPISITAFGGDFLTENGMVLIEDVSRMTPNFSINTTYQATNNRITIRGIGSVGNSAIESSVGVFIDGVYYPRPGSVIGVLLDVNTFEVLVHRVIWAVPFGAAIIHGRRQWPEVSRTVQEV